jgi:hypothetical protein
MFDSDDIDSTTLPAIDDRTVDEIADDLLPDDDEEFAAPPPAGTDLPGPTG